MTAQQAALPLDNPFTAPDLPRLRGTERQIAFASSHPRPRSSASQIERQVRISSSRNPVGVRAARARHFAAWAKALQRGRTTAKPDRAAAEAEALAAGGPAIRAEMAATATTPEGAAKLLAAAIRHAHTFIRSTG
jgi:hypothetical protein